MHRTSRSASLNPFVCLVGASLVALACSSGEGARTGSGGSSAPAGATGGGIDAAAGAVGSGGAVSTGGLGAAGAGGAAGTRGSGGGAGQGVAGAAGGGSGIVSSGTCSGSSAMNGDVTVNLGSLQQKISGFGVSTAWGSTMSASDAASLWSRTTGAGLSLHRVRIDYTNGQTSEINIAKMAVSYGVTVWATPWTPPVADKSNDNPVEGTLTNGAAFATFLTGFVGWMQSQGVPIYAVSE